MEPQEMPEDDAEIFFGDPGAHFFPTDVEEAGRHLRYLSDGYCNDAKSKAAIRVLRHYLPICPRPYIPWLMKEVVNFLIVSEGEHRARPETVAEAEVLLRDMQQESQAVTDRQVEAVRALYTLFNQPNTSQRVEHWYRKKLHKLPDELPRLSPHFDVRKVIDVGYRQLSSETWNLALHPPMDDGMDPVAYKLSQIHAIVTLAMALIGCEYNCVDAPSDLLQQCIEETIDALFAQGWIDEGERDMAIQIVNGFVIGDEDTHRGEED